MALIPLFAVLAFFFLRLLGFKDQILAHIFSDESLRQAFLERNFGSAEESPQDISREDVAELMSKDFRNNKPLSLQSLPGRP